MLGAAVAALVALPAAPAAAAAPPTAAAAALTPQAVPAARGDLMQMSVNRRKSKYRVRTPSNFTGFSSEYTTVTFMTGQSYNGTNGFMNGLYNNLTATGSGTPVLRVGGGSTDNSAWNPSLSRARPIGVNYDLTYEHLNRLVDFTKRTRAKLILGVNLASTLKTARDWTSVASRALGRSVLFYEIGNEPDNYGTRPTFPLNGVNYRPRKRSYSFKNFLVDFLTARAVCARPFLTRGSPGRRRAGRSTTPRVGSARSCAVSASG